MMAPPAAYSGRDRQHPEGPDDRPVAFVSASRLVPLAFDDLAPALLDRSYAWLAFLAANPALTVAGDPASIADRGGTAGPADPDAGRIGQRSVMLRVGVGHLRVPTVASVG